MFYINKNISLNQLQDLIKKNLYQREEYLPESFNSLQKQALEIFQKRIFLESILEDTISFNKKLFWEDKYKNLSLVKNAEELIEVFKLRSEVFLEINYDKECPDTIEGLNFDVYDKNSAIIFYKNNKEITATIRLIFDSDNKLPSESKYSFDDMREKYNCIGEISRNIVKNRGHGLNLEFKYLMCGIYNIFINNNIDIALSGIKQEHFKLFKKLGGVDIYKKMSSYGNLDIPFLIISYNPQNASNFFKKVFLEE
ncbi:N-acyl amino acid synthase FeeM domain-containing protein [Aliarcobacter lanthieri]|uniref:N-acyl amino acid synthase FeeM domain-containing protein n=1 Tax=Aliarcobacter lanthieri TaxID=1355374 RepID=UPI003AFA3603